jgi:hypothetical protein
MQPTDSKQHKYSGALRMLWLLARPEHSNLLLTYIRSSNQQHSNLQYKTEITINITPKTHLSFEMISLDVHK